MKRNIRIEVSSETAHGKTTIANHLKRHLESLGCNNVTLEDIDSPMGSSQLAQQLPAVLDGLHVEIVTKQAKSGLWDK